MIAEKVRVDALVVWDMCCGTIGRPCPKLVTEPERAVVLEGGRTVPPPCIYLFPKSLPDPRNNPDPAPWELAQLPFIATLADAFGCRKEELFTVHIQTRNAAQGVERITRLGQGGKICRESGWTPVKRARG